ncbi:hypothetical protein [Paraglaciecola sp.]|uniref:hypothetical protein n=1 Tax=Paraglaciecola sp. TaxID=1920173 RepID=UPI003EFACD3C
MKNVILNSKVLKAFVVAGSLLVSTFSAHADLVLSFDQSDVEVGLNETFNLDLYVDVTTQVDSILTWGLDLDLSDSSVLNLDSFTLGGDFSSLISDDGIGGAAKVPGLFGSNILLGTFEFTAVGYGSTVATTSNTVGDLFEGFATTNFFGPSSFNSASANISVVSAPATITILALASLALFGFRRKA